MKKDEKFCKILFGAVLLEVGVLGAVGLAIAAAVLRQGSTSGLLRAMESTGAFYPALLLFLAGCAGFYICCEQMKNRGPDYQPKVVWRDDEETKRAK